MSRTITISLPLTELNASMAFYAARGFVINPRFTDDTAALLVRSKSSNAMLVTHAKWMDISAMLSNE